MMLIFLQFIGYGRTRPVSWRDALQVCSNDDNFHELKRKHEGRKEGLYLCSCTQSSEAAKKAKVAETKNLPELSSSLDPRNIHLQQTVWQVVGASLHSTVLCLAAMKIQEWFFSATLTHFF
ncbi:PREDICTED: uncharacterized protein LOC109159373 isoform X2 [Ipomoea nil]|uniref:uncharacterized protein LOC109159373 isoform X2 n=1 Tax=Ipomoea nil TaxID=35883 RepID=UPI000900D21E|nr:PREDICTED: uncharacterized protein LOC109159373 isoform X2 [Ipomoea nil]